MILQLVFYRYSAEQLIVDTAMQRPRMGTTIIIVNGYDTVHVAFHL